jgi:hypothetical protein
LTTISAGVNGDPGTDGDHGLQLQPTVSWPHVMTVGRQYLVEVDLDLVTAAGTAPAVWPFDDEEYAYTCLLNGGEDFSLWAVHDASVVVHRFGGSYGPAQFVVTANAGRGTDDSRDSRSLRLTILNPWGVRIDTFVLGISVRLDDGDPLPEPTVDVLSSGSQNGTRPHLPDGRDDPVTPPPALPPDLDGQDNLAQQRDHPSEPPTDPGVDPPPFRSDQLATAALTEQYGLVALQRSRSGSLHFDHVPLFGPGADTGYTVSFTVRCLPSDNYGTVFATFAESPTDPDAPPRLLVMQSAEIPPGTYQLTAELLHPYPGHVRFHGLPVTLRDDPRSWDEIMAAVPLRLPAGTGPTHLIAAIEISGEPAMVLRRIQRVTALFEHVAEESAELTSYSVITYGPHHINSNRDTYPEIPVHTLAWAVSVESTLDTLDGLAYHGALPKGYPFAAQVECVLAELANRLTGREGRPVLVTAGARPPHPRHTDPETQYIPCPEHNDGLAIRSWLKGRHPGMGFGAIRDPGREDNLWEQLGSDVTNGPFYAPDFAARLGLTGQPVQLLPLPLLVS